MTDVRVPLNDLHRSMSAAEKELSDAVLRVLRSGWYVLGPEHNAFEAEFAAFCGVADCVAVANGTEALELALAAVTSSGDRVVTVANAGMYSTTAIRRIGAIPVYADVDADTLCMSPDSLEAVLDEGVRAVVVTHLYGRLAPVEEIVALCSPRGIAVVEDCAQAVGAERAGRRAGSFGDIAAFSFYPTKNLGALGDGGAITTNRAELATLARRRRQYGWVSKYVVDTPGGMNSRLDEIQAAVLRVRLPQVSGLNQRRRDILQAYQQAAAAGGAGRVAFVNDESHVAHLGVLVTTDREPVRAALTAAGIAVDVHYPIPDHRQPVAAQEFSNIDLPVTEFVAHRILSLPLFPELREEEVDRVCRALRAI